MATKARTADDWRSMIYNPEIKVDLYLNGSGISERQVENIRSLFARLSEYERELDMDIANMTADQIGQIFNKSILYGRGSHSTALRYTKALLPYIRFFRGLHPSNEPIPSEKDIIAAFDRCADERFRQSMVGDPQGLQSILDTICSPEESNDNTLVVRGYFWFAFIGINKLDAMSIRTKDMDILDMTISYKGKTLRLPQESHNCFRRLYILDHFILKNPNPNSSKSTAYPRSNTDCLLRRPPAWGAWANADTGGINSLSEFVSRALSKSCLDVYPTYHSVEYSGLFYRNYDPDDFSIPTFAEYLRETYPYPPNASEKERKTVDRNRYSWLSAAKKDFVAWREAFHS